MKGRKIFWGVFFICAAILIIGVPMGFIGDAISPFKLIVTVLLSAVIIESLIHLNFFGVTMPIAFILWMFADELGITQIVPWGVFASAAFLAVGLSMIFKKHKHFGWHGKGRMNCGKNYAHNYEPINTENNADNISDNQFNYSVSFGATTKYINSDCLKNASLRCSFGSMSVYFDGAKLSEEGASVFLDCSFSGIELYIPKEWRVVNNVENVMAGVDEKGMHRPGDGPVLQLNGKINFSGVEIYYI